MTRRGVVRAGLASLLLAWGIAACDSPTRPGGTELTGPTAVAATVVKDVGGAEYTLINGRPPSVLSVLEVSKLIGLGGGTLSLAGHTLTVPAGTVTAPTLFTMTLGSTGLVEVELTAVRLGLLTVDVGAAGFDRPVTVSLTYAWATNVSDPGKLVVLRRPDTRNPFHLSMGGVVDEGKKVVTAQLPSFSRYCLASN